MAGSDEKCFSLFILLSFEIHWVLIVFNCKSRNLKELFQCSEEVVVARSQIWRIRWIFLQFSLQSGKYLNNHRHVNKLFSNEFLVFENHYSDMVWMFYFAKKKFIFNLHFSFSSSLWKFVEVKPRTLLASVMAFLNYIKNSHNVQLEYHAWIHLIFLQNDVFGEVNPSVILTRKVDTIFFSYIVVMLIMYKKPLVNPKMKMEATLFNRNIYIITLFIHSKISLRATFFGLYFVYDKYLNVQY